MTTEVEVPSWLKSLSLAPEYHPTEAEFSDPIDYIFRIEPEAAQYGICKIVPPYLKASKPVVFNNLNLSLANSQDTGDSLPVVARSMGPARTMGGSTTTQNLGLESSEGGKARFTTRRQQLGWNARKVRTGLVPPQAVVHKLVWQSGETYTLDQFESKAKIFARNKLGGGQENSPQAVEALFWKATLEKAISIEYANDIPGSAFAEPRDEKEKDKDKDMAVLADEGEGLKGAEGENGRSIGCKLSESAWNMRRVARSPGSLLRFIPDEVPGVTSPMVYIGMLFSWFAWHVEDHELHSLNYLHTGAPKTWYAVPGEAAPALEEVVRVQGYASQLSAQDAFARLGEKTTVMSPEVLLAAGVPCCRLVQNAGEYVVTFPRAYHLGFSHGFNCGEAANFATPGWLHVAREASVRRAAMKYLPMLSHQQLLYTLAASLISRSLFDIDCEKRSSRLKEKKRVGEEVVKSMFVNDAIQQNDMIGKLLDNKVTSCLLVKDMKKYAPHAVSNTLERDMPSKMCKLEEGKCEQVVPEGNALECPATSILNDAQVLPSSPLASMAVEVPVKERQEISEVHEVHDSSGTMERSQVCGGDLVTSALPRDLSTLPCAACGILCYTGMAIVQPSQIAATTLRPLHSYASGPASYRSKGTLNPLSGVLPGKADKKSADFHMLPSVEGQPLLELEGTTPDSFADTLYEEPEVCTPDLSECPTTNKNCSNDATLDADFPRSGQTSAVSERDEYFFPEGAKAVSSVGNDRGTPNNGVEETMEIEKQTLEIESRLGSAVSGDPLAQVSNSGASLYCIDTNPDAEGMLSSLQLLAATYEGDSDVDEYDEIEDGVADNAMGEHLTGPSPSNEIISGLSGSENSNLNALIMLSPSASETLALKGTPVCSVEQFEEHMKSGVEMDNCKTTCNSLEETGRSLIGSSSGHAIDKIKDGKAAARDEAKPKSALSFGECVTCSLPHDSFFDSFEEAVLRSVENVTMELENGTMELENGTMELENGTVELENGTVELENEAMELENGTMEPENSEKNIVVCCDGIPKTCTLVAPESDMELIEPVGTLLVEVGSLLPECSSVTTDSCSIKLGEALNRRAILAATQHPDVNGVREVHGVVEPVQMDLNVSNELPNLKGAARPRMLCLEHAVAAQKILEPIGGGTVIIICHSSFPKVEEEAKAVAAEVGAHHEWRSVPFKQAGEDDYKIITSAVEAQEEFLPGDKDWVDQLGLSVHGQSKSLSNDVEIANGNPSSEESEEPGNRRIWKGRKEKKSSIIRQWCGRGWRADQLHSLLRGCRSTCLQIDSTIAPANVCPSAGVSSFVENGRSRKTVRPARLSEYTPYGRAPKGESHTKKSCNKRKILLEMSEDEYDEQNSEAIPPRQGGTHDRFFNNYGSSGDSLWREVPIASTDSFLLPHHLTGLSGGDMAAEKDHEDFLFAPQSLYRAEDEIRLSASEANTSGTMAMINGASQSCAVVGGFVQRGAKLIAQQKLQKLCRQLSTPASVPYTPLTTPTRFASWVKPSHERISAAKLVNRLKRKPATDLPRYSKKQRVPEGGEQESQPVSLSRGESGDRREEGIVTTVSMSVNNNVSLSDEAKTDILQDHETPSRGKDELNTDISNNHSEITAGVEDERLKPCDSDTQDLQDCASRFIGNTDSSPTESFSQQYHYGIEDPPKDMHCSSEKTPQIDPNSVSVLMYCTESLPQGLNDQSTREPAEAAASIVHAEPVLVPRKGRVRGKRTKSNHWKSCIQMPSSEAEDVSVSPTCDENRSSGDGSNDPVALEPKLNAEGRRDSGAQADPDFFPYLSSNTSVRRRRICSPGMAEWGADKDGNTREAQGSANDHPSVQHQDPKMKKRKTGQKPANKRCEDLEGEFQCDMEGCIMAFDSIRDLQLHKKNLCTWKGCGKHFHMHKYLLQHRRVHLDDRPLKCPVKGCTQAFKWAWARTEHIRVHTGERPYKCMVSGCGQTFRFVSDFSRHKRNTGHRPT